MKRKGFTLIELAIVLTIVGVVVGGSFQALKYSREKAYVAEAKERVMASKDAIIGYSMSWVDLPTWDEFDSNLSSLSNDNRTFKYFQDPLLSADEDICRFNTTNLQVKQYAVDGSSRTISDIAFVLAEQGTNRMLQTALDSDEKTVKIYAKNQHVDKDGAINPDYPEYDDVTSYTTLRELQSLVDCKQDINILTNYFPQIEINATYITEVKIFTDTEGEDYNWSVKLDSDTSGANNIIEYTCGTAVTSKNINDDSPPDWSPSYRCDILKFDINYTTSEPTHKLDINVTDDYGNSLIKSYAISPR